MTLRAAAVLLAVAASVRGEDAEHTSEDILAECSAGASTEPPAKRHFKGSTIGFVTPWHPAGKDVAVRRAKQFDFISPFWYHIQPHDLSSLDVSKWTVEVVPALDTPEGRPNKTWVETLQAAGTKVVPVFAFYGWRKPQLANFFMHPDAGYMQHSASRQIVQLCKEMDCDGLVMEWGAIPVNDFYAQLTPWLDRVKGSMTKFLTKEYSLMLNVHADPSNFGRRQFEALATTVNRFVLHTYNFTGPVLAGGPNSPIHWFNDMLKAWRLVNRKDASDLVLVTLNTFGREYRDDAKLDLENYKAENGALDENGAETRWDVTGTQYQALLRKGIDDPTLELDHQWNSDFHEHIVQFKTPEGDPRSVYYPSTRSLKERLEILSNADATGVGFWNLGTGLDHFYDLL